MVVINKPKKAGTVVQIRDPLEEKSHCITVHNMSGEEIKNRLEFLIKRLQESDGEGVFIRHYKNNRGNKE